MGQESAAAKSQRELMARSVNHIVAQLIAAHKEGKDVNLNRLKCDVASKFGMSNQPKLVDIIAAVPPDYKVLEPVKYRHNSLLRISLCQS